MSQNDFNIANQGFPSFRSDLNGALQALASNSAGATAPSTTYAYQFWYDETNELLKMRNSDNDAWITIGTFDQTADTFSVDKIAEGNSSVEVVDTGTGYVAITVDGVEAARVDTNGRLGIKTSSPAALLEVNGGAVDYTSSASGTGLFHVDGGASSVYTAYIGVADDGVRFGHNGSGVRSLMFETNETERARLTNSGDFLIGKTTTSATGAGLWLYNPGYGRINYSTDTTSTSFPAIFYNNSGSQVGSITYTTTTTSYNTSSDYRLKENLTTLDGAAERLAQIPVHRFNFINEPDRIVDGFLAHEVQAIVPEAVQGEKDAVDADGNPEYQGIDQGKLVPLLTAALQEALQKIDALEARVTVLEG